MAVGRDNWVLRTTNGGDYWEMNYIDSIRFNLIDRVAVTSMTSANVLRQDLGIYKYKAGGWTDLA